VVAAAAVSQPRLTFIEGFANRTGGEVIPHIPSQVQYASYSALYAAKKYCVDDRQIECSLLFLPVVAEYSKHATVDNLRGEKICGVGVQCSRLTYLVEAHGGGKCCLSNLASIVPPCALLGQGTFGVVLPMLLGVKCREQTSCAEGSKVEAFFPWY
jgi:hypothetical protein